MVIDPVRLQLCPFCKSLFGICRRCDRGQVYCSRTCAAIGRLASNRRARKRYRASPEGKEDHRIREKERRQRQRLERLQVVSVGDHGSTPADIKASCPPEVPAPEPRSGAELMAMGLETSDVHVPIPVPQLEAEPLAATAPQTARVVPASTTHVCCAYCGRPGYVVFLDRRSWLRSHTSFDLPQRHLRL